MRKLLNYFKRRKRIQQLKIHKRCILLTDIFSNKEIYEKTEAINKELIKLGASIVFF